MTYVQGISGHDAENTLLKLGITCCPFCVPLSPYAIAQRETGGWLLLARKRNLEGWWARPGGAAGGVGVGGGRGREGSVGGATVGTRPLRREDLVSERPGGLKVNLNCQQVLNLDEDRL